MVMGGDSSSKGCEFESQHHGHFFRYVFVVKFVFEKTKINEKEAGVVALTNKLVAVTILVLARLTFEADMMGL